MSRPLRPSRHRTKCERGVLEGRSAAPGGLPQVRSTSHKPTLFAARAPAAQRRWADKTARRESWPRRSISRTSGSERRTRDVGDSRWPPPFRMMELNMFTRWSIACFCGNVYVAPPCRCSVCGRTFSSESMNELRLRASRTWQTEEPALGGSRTLADELDDLRAGDRGRLARRIGRSPASPQ